MHHIKATSEHKNVSTRTSYLIVVPEMPSVKLSSEQTAARFGVHKAIDTFPASLTAQEEANVKTVLEYMEVKWLFSVDKMVYSHA